jgi:uncharacterized protein (TIGR03067 family)
MRRTVWLLVGVLLVLPSLGSDAPKDYDGAVRTEDIEGEWRLVSCRFGGESASEGGRAIWTFRDGQFIPGEWNGLKRTYTVAPSVHGPAPIDLGAEFRHEKIAWLTGIYHLDGDTLLLGLDRCDNERPKNFRDAACFYVLKRVK